MEIRTPRNTIFLSVWVQVVCLSSARHKDLKVIFGSIATLNGSEDIVAGSNQ